MITVTRRMTFELVVARCSLNVFEIRLAKSPANAPVVPEQSTLNGMST